MMVSHDWKHALLLWVSLLACAFCTIEAVNCPGDIIKVLDPGQTCLVPQFTVDGEQVKNIPWSGSGLRPGHDCFPEGTTGYTYSVDKVEMCKYTLIIKGVCSWKPNPCWPGDCDGGMSQNCQCRSGFSRDYSNRDGKTCEPSSYYSRPDLSTCHIGVMDMNNTNTDSPTSGPLTNCNSQQDIGIKTQPTKMTFTVKADLNHDLGNLTSYVSESKFGVIGANIEVVKVALSGTKTSLQNKTLNTKPPCQKAVSALNPIMGTEQHDCEGEISLPTVGLHDGDSLCAVITAYGGGFYNLVDYQSRPQGTVTFKPTESSKQICFHYDQTKPAHCTETSPSSCSTQPLTLSTRLTRTAQVRVDINGWMDPRPRGGETNPMAASGIHLFRLEVHGVDISNSTLSVQENAREGLTVVWNVSTSFYRAGGPYYKTVTLPEEGGARLYALILEVHDNAKNVGYARRLLLYDRNSTVELFPSTSLKVIHANPRSGDRWQTDVSKELCVDWTNHFYNTDMYNNNFLKPVNVDNGREIRGEYDQVSGILPISGTDNVRGVTKFEMSWRVDEGQKTPYTNISDVFAQKECIQRPLQDGETYDVYIKASDIMGNTQEDSVRVSIDHTGPEVSVWGLRGRWDTDGLYVHNSTDLSKMKLVLTAQDPHSGLSTIHWTLGTHRLASDVGERAVGVQRQENMTSCNGTENCYCPIVNDCEIFHYVVTFPNLVHLNTHQGDHHRDYYITITVTNMASLTTTTTLDLLLDESPPTVGVVWEGLSVDGQAEMDFTSSRVVQARWHGFDDRESGMMLSRAVLAQRCLTMEEVDSAPNATVVHHPETMTSFTFPREGLYYVTVVGYNGAMEPSQAACSDGITYDTTPPVIVNVSMTHARTGQKVGCTQQGEAWLVNSNMTRVSLSNVSECHCVCFQHAAVADVSHLPLSSSLTLDPQLSERHCLKLAAFSEDSFLVLPSDYVRVWWQGRDADSDMEEYYVGMGTDRTTSAAPDLLPFTPTHGHPSYHARHAGLSHGDVFFFFLQAVNKAGLSTNLTLGPVLIDVTPPDVIKPLTAVVERDELKVSWNDDVFVDAEQPQGADFDFSFRVGNEGGFLTPFLQLPESSLAHCRHGNVTGCARYPLSTLYQHDTQEGRAFFFQLHVTNAAGHVTSVNTSSVRLPAHFPPSHALIQDVVKIMVPQVIMTTPVAFTSTATAVTDMTSSETATTDDQFVSYSTPTNPPTSTGSLSSSDTPVTTADRFTLVTQWSSDLDAILQRQEVCTAWNGFYHQEDVTIHAGLGTRPDHDDVVSFQLVTNASNVCFNVTSAPVYTKLFSVVRATSSGGTAIFSSDGFVMLPHNDSDNAIRIFHGPGCHDNNIVGRHVMNLSISVMDLGQTLKSPVHVGDFLFVKLSPFVHNVTFTNAILLETTLTGYQLVAMTPNVSITMPVSLATNVSVQIQQCQKDYELLPLPADRVTVTWETRGPWQRWLRYMKIETVDASCVKTAVKKSKYSHQQCVVQQARVWDREGELRVHTSNVVNGHTYLTSLQPCFDDGCLPAVSSRPATFVDPRMFAVTVEKAAVLDVTSDGFDVDVATSIAHDPALASDLAAMPWIFRWTVSRDHFGSVLLGEWFVESSTNLTNTQIQKHIRFDGDSKGTLFYCIQTLYPLRSNSPICVQLHRDPQYDDFDPFHVVELDHSKFRETDFEPFLGSQQLGSKLHQLFDLDLDFAKSNVMLSAVLTNSRGLNVTWFLMTDRHVPDLGDCAGDEDCETSSRTATGYVTFPRHRSSLQANVVYFICAAASSGSAAVEACGDGVVVDDASPVAGIVAVANADRGFLGNRGQVTVTWSDFSDVEKDVFFLPDDVTLNYSVALGSFLGSEDVSAFVHVGQRTSWSFVHLLQSANTLYANVRAQDRVGHVTEVSSDRVTIDSTPPTVDRVSAGTIIGENFIPGGELPVHWEGVEDRESGILSIEVGVADERGGDNLVDFRVCEGTSIILNDVTSLVDGHAYVALLKVTNKAGLTTLESSEPFVIDSSPPSPGNVWFRGENMTTLSGYSTQVGVISVEWAGFTDPHSGLQYYRVGLGSKPEDTDVLPFVHVATHTSHTWREDLQQGIKYYATLQVCNRAGLCRVTSSGSITFDNSPPTPGHVTVGPYGQHDKFLGHNTSVPVQWTGFSDPQTGIQHFTWCVGTSPTLCNVTAPHQTLLSSAAHGAGLKLPLATPLYVTVRASNPAGLETVSVSDSFQVDPTPPEVVTKPHFLSPRDRQPAVSQWDRSVLHVTWQIRDPESSVVSHTVYVRSKLTGRLVVDPVLLGAEDELLLTLDEASLLNDGDYHWASITACNAAHLCVTANSDVISIDSTPPFTGTFLSPLHWNRGPSHVSGDVMTTIDVMWQDFTDPESGVTKYWLLTGSDYNGQEMSGGRVAVPHDNSSLKQSYSLQVREELKSDQLLHLAVLAENALGLSSPMLRVEFRCLLDNHNGTSGSLVLVRHSCQSSYCSNECTCAATGRLCPNTTACVALDPALPGLSPFTVLPALGPPHTLGQKVSTSAKCLEGQWSLQRPESLFNVSRFQASFSLANTSAGEGVFDQQTEPVWMDMGRHMTTLHCLPGNRMLQSGQSYVMYVRLWPSRDSYITFTSLPMLVDHTPPQVPRGKSVIESDSSCFEDVDYVTKKHFYVTACWNGVFRDSQSAIVNYHVWMGTSPHGSDHLDQTDVGLNVSWTFPTMLLEHGTRYYVTVRAWNEAGLQTTAVSDGFIVDVTSPVSGVVFNTGRHSNAHAQSSSSAISASWHGFEDRHSGVRSYEVAVYDLDNVTHPIMPLTNVGVETAVLLDNLTLQHLHSYQVSVNAQDAAGLLSQVSESAAILIDVTPPEGVTCTDFRQQEEKALSLQTSYQHDARYMADLSLDVVASGEVVRVVVSAAGLQRSADGVLHLDQLKMPLHFRFSPSGVASAQHDFLSPHTGAILLKVVVEAPRGATITAKLYQCTATILSLDHAVTIRQMSPTSVSVCARIRDLESGVKTMMVGVGTTESGLQVAPWTTVGHSGHVTFTVHVQHASTLYATVVTQNQAGQWSRFVSHPLTFDTTPPRLGDLTLTLKYEGEGEGNATEMQAEATWTSEDKESGVESCTCTLNGPRSVEPTTQNLDGSAQGQCQWQLRDPRHGSDVKVTISCINGVQIQNSVTSPPAVILLRAPDLSQVVMTSLSNNAVTSPYHRSTPQARSSNSSLQFFWQGVQDPTVTTLYFRFLYQSSPLTEWSPLHVYKTAFILEREEGRTGEVTAELKAVNEKMMTSDVVSAVVPLDDSKPQLTGAPATVSVSGKQVHLDWRNVFQVTRDVTFSLFAGTEEGFGDVINHVTTSTTSYKGYNAVQMTSSIYVIIQAVYDNGAETIYRDLLKL